MINYENLTLVERKIEYAEFCLLECLCFAKFKIRIKKMRTEPIGNHLKFHIKYCGGSYHACLLVAPMKCMVSVMPCLNPCCIWHLVVYEVTCIWQLDTAMPYKNRWLNKILLANLLTVAFLQIYVYMNACVWSAALSSTHNWVSRCLAPSYLYKCLPLPVSMIAVACIKSLSSGHHRTGFFSVSQLFRNHVKIC